MKSTLAAIRRIAQRDRIGYLEVLSLHPNTTHRANAQRTVQRAVSYTHLDVYKRQPLPRDQPGVDGVVGAARHSDGAAKHDADDQPASARQVRFDDEFF